MVKGLFSYLFFCALAFSVHAEYRTWTDKDGGTIRAEWIGVTQNDRLICRVAPSGKLMCFQVSFLSRDDQRYVDGIIGKTKFPVYVKFDGRWMTRTEMMEHEQETLEAKRKNQDQQREKRYILQAKKMISSYTPKKECREYAIRIFQVLGDSTALCNLGVWHQKIGSIDRNVGRYSFNEGSELFFCPDLPERIVAEGDIFRVKSIFWAGTYTYESKSRDLRTVAAYAVNEDMAVRRIRLTQKMFEPGDARFERSGPNVPKPSQRPPASEGDDGGSCLSFGSGFFVTPDGYLVTNYHVVEGATRVVVKMGTKFIDAEIVKIDQSGDLALLKVPGRYVPMTLAGNRTERMGREVFTMGFPKPMLQGFEPKVTCGVISSCEGFQGDVNKYQIDAAIQPGNSGGPLADKNGCLVGVIVSSLRDSQNVNYAIKKSRLLQILDSVEACSSQLVFESTKVSIPFEDVVSKVKESCVQILSYSSK